jgi:NADH-quinone oxidoreductase subunit C
LKARVSETDLRIATVSGVWRGANWLERETYDMYGIRFEGHPDLRRIYLYEQFQGHPLRKDYPKEKRQPLVARQDVEPAQARRQHERDREGYGRWR